MQREMGKESPDTGKLLDGMTRTFAARRHWIAKERPSAQEALQRFQALERAEEVSVNVAFTVPFISFITIPDMYFRSS